MMPAITGVGSNEVRSAPPRSGAGRPEPLAHSVDRAFADYLGQDERHASAADAGAAPEESNDGVSDQRADTTRAEAPKRSDQDCCEPVPRPVATFAEAMPTALAFAIDCQWLPMNPGQRDDGGPAKQDASRIGRTAWLHLETGGLASGLHVPEQSIAAANELKVVRLVSHVRGGGTRLRDRDAPPVGGAPELGNTRPEAVQALPGAKAAEANMADKRFVAQDLEAQLAPAGTTSGPTAQADRTRSKSVGPELDGSRPMDASSAKEIVVDPKSQEGLPSRADSGIVPAPASSSRPQPNATATETATWLMADHRVETGPGTAQANTLRILDVVLSPPELGDVKLRLRSAGASMRIELTLPDTDVARRVGNVKGDLEQGLLRQEVAVEDITVSVGVHRSESASNGVVSPGSNVSEVIPKDSERFDGSGNGREGADGRHHPNRRKPDSTEQRDESAARDVTAVYV